MSTSAVAELLASLRRLLWGSAVAFQLSGCASDPVEDSGPPEIIAILHDDLSVVCADEAGPTAVRLEAFPRQCAPADCPSLVQGARLECDADASGDVKVRLIEPGVYVLELLYFFDAGEGRECYAPSGKDHLLVPDDYDDFPMPPVVQLEFRGDGSCPPD